MFLTPEKKFQKIIDERIKNKNTKILFVRNDFEQIKSILEEYSDFNDAKSLKSFVKRNGKIPFTRDIEALEVIEVKKASIEPLIYILEEEKGISYYLELPLNGYFTKYSTADDQIIYNYIDHFNKLRSTKPFSYKDGNYGFIMGLKLDDKYLSFNEMLFYVLRKHLYLYFDRNNDISKLNINSKTMFKIRI